MEVVNPRAALLSNYEVLALLKELESDHIIRAKTAVKIKKEEALGNPNHPGPTFGEASENLRTVEIEAIQYLSADHTPTQRQTPDGITKLVRALELYNLTKAEKLQVVNLAPTLPVELYVIIEELEDRVGDKIEEILGLVHSSLSEPTVTTTDQGSVSEPNSRGQAVYQEDIFSNELDGHYEEDVTFDDTGEGAGVEGDLDMEED